MNYEKAVNKIVGLEVSASKIDEHVGFIRTVPGEFNIASLPNFKVWLNKDLKTFSTNITAKRVFEDVFAMQ